MLELRGVETFYGSIQALHQVSLRVEAGEIVTLIGANGAGKSTTLMSISGITPPRRGEVLFHDKPIQHLAPDRIVRLGISQVPEGRHIFPELTVAENLDMGAFLRNDSEGIAQDRDYIYSLFPILHQRRSQQGGYLSGGEQQMLAISRALMARPTMLLLDKPGAAFGSCNILACLGLLAAAPSLGWELWPVTLVCAGLHAAYNTVAYVVCQGAWCRQLQQLRLQRHSRQLQLRRHRW